MNDCLELPSEICKRPDLPMYVKLVYAVIGTSLKNSASLLITKAGLAKRCGIAPHLASRALRYLVLLRLITFHRSINNHELIQIYKVTE